MASFFKKNKVILEKKFPEFLNLKKGESTEVEVIESRTGELVPLVLIENRKVSLHSKFDPRKEACRFAEQLDSYHYDLYVVQGCGFAYHLEALQTKISQNAKILVIEHNFSIFCSLLENRDLANLLNDSRLVFMLQPSEEQLSDFLYKNSSAKLCFLTHRGSFQLAPDYYTNTQRMIKSLVSKKDVNIATLAKFEKIWSSNIIRNAPAVLKCPGINIFKNKFNGQTAIIIGAGPSLNEVLSQLKKIQDRAVLICVDTAYKHLMAAGIEPDFCVAVDPQVINARYFEETKQTKTILITDPAIHPTVFRLFKGRIIVADSAFNMLKWITQFGGERGEMAYGGSVSTTAYDLAQQFGFSQIVLVAQDLAFSQGYAHMRGAYLEELLHQRTSRLQTIADFNRGQIKALPVIMLPGIENELVATNQKMLIFKKWFENHRKQNLVNATCWGVKLDNIIHTPLNNLVFSNGKNFDFDLFYQKALLTVDKIENLEQQLQDTCQSMLHELADVIPLLENANKLTEELCNLLETEKTNQAKVDYILKKLDTVDQKLQKLTTLKEMIGFTVQRVLQTIKENYDLAETEKISPQQYIAKRSQFLYSGLLDGCYFIQKLLTKLDRQQF